ncbi:uncharacterized protein [Aegilops tauschii subsp. strangulata]|uniref:uncharacterized protein n=1 Tax=Aegilops tauschii subsp. strangulata TaxID=200361 RepID=UPI001ABBEB71|nr:uncharacterized protein LOC120972808 [Aegilops tauschii subsp. strangulata]
MEESISDDEEVTLLEDLKEKLEDGMEQPPDWLPDGWIMEVRRDDNGALYKYFISPVTGVKFRLKEQVLDYLFSEMEEHYIESNDCVACSTPHAHEWLPDGWLVEVRAGGEKMEKMYKFYLFSPLEVRVFSKEDVLLYTKEKKIFKCDTDGQCDTDSQDNILATVEFNPHGLPQGWVKEVVYRKSEERIRKDSYFTDPVSHKVFRSLNYATHYINTGEVKKHALVQRASVHEVYNFEKSADMHEIFRKKPRKNVKARKTLESSLKPRRSSTRKKKNCNEHTSYRCVAHISFFRFVHTVT